MTRAILQPPHISESKLCSGWVQLQGMRLWISLICWMPFSTIEMGSASTARPLNSGGTLTIYFSFSTTFSVISPSSLWMPRSVNRPVMHMSDWFSLQGWQMPQPRRIAMLTRSPGLMPVTAAPMASTTPDIS